MDYECHITVPQSHSSEAGHVAWYMRWKTSEIARDPLLGDDTHFYLTCHATDYDIIWRKMRSTIAHLEAQHVPVLREKIERIEHDVRY